MIRQTNLETAERVVNILENEFGFKNVKKTRFGKMLKITKRGRIEPWEKDFPIILESLLDFKMLDCILSQRKRFPKDVFTRKLKTIIGGKSLPKNEKGATPGRDIQTELYFASLCAAADLKPILEEPDITF